jgi:LuxR family maltose regulon positive regulatory protein
MFTNHLDAAEARIQDAERFVQAHSAMSADQVRDILGRAAVTRATLVRLYGDLPQCVDLASRALNLLPESDLFWRASPLVHLASAYELDGDVTPVREQLAIAAIAPARASGNLFTILRSITNLAHLQTLQGRLRQAEATYRSAAQIVTGQDRLNVLVGSAAYYYGIGNLLRERNDLDAAEPYFGHGLDMVMGTLTVDADVVTDGYIALARLKQARGDSAGALETLQAFMQLARQRKFVPRLMARGSAAQAQQALARGDLDAAVQWVKANDMRAADAQATEYPHEFEYLTLARVLIAQGRHDPEGHYLRDALRLLDRLLEAAEIQARIGSVIEIHLLRALALHTQGNSTEALTLLARTLTLAEPEGYVRLFVDEGEPMKLLFADFGFWMDKQATQLQSYVTQLLAAFPGTSPVTSASQIPNPSEPLSARELEVLHLIEAGLTNQEIAQKLVVAISTVKKHINSIFSKLNVQSRTQALARARELSLL